MKEVDEKVVVEESVEAAVDRQNGLREYHLEARQYLRRQQGLEYLYYPFPVSCVEVRKQISVTEVVSYSVEDTELRFSDLDYDCYVHEPVDEYSSVKWSGSVES